jgi:hypothetical protein
MGGSVGKADATPGAAPGRVWTAHRPPRCGPLGADPWGRLPGGCRGGHRLQHRDQRGDLLRGGVTADGEARLVEVRRLVELVETLCDGAGQSGMFPCFFGGSVSRLDRSRRSARTISVRVSWGWITAST